MGDDGDDVIFEYDDEDDFFEVCYDDIDCFELDLTMNYVAKQNANMSMKDLIASGQIGTYQMRSIFALLLHSMKRVHEQAVEIKKMHDRLLMPDIIKMSADDTEDLNKLLQRLCYAVKTIKIILR